MKPIENIPDFDTDWPATPKDGAVTWGDVRPSKILAIAKAGLAVSTTENIGKAIQRIQHQNFKTVWKSFRNTLLGQMELANKQEMSEETVPLMPLQLGQPLVSIVIPCFNYGRFVEAAIDSVLAQTVESIEIIVIDGGSTDGVTRDLLTQLNRPRTQVFLREGRHLVGSNRNFGIERARGRYICCLDADDTLAPTYLEKALYLLETLGYDCVSTAIRFTGARQGTVGILELPHLRAMMNGNHMLTCAVFRRSLWVRAGGFYDTGLGAEHVAEDWDFWLRLTAEGARLRNISGEALFNYRIHETGSLSSTNVRPISEQREAIFERNRHLLTTKHQRLSANQAKRFLRCAHSGGALSEAMSQHKSERSPCLLIALPFLLVGGAERLLSSLIGSLVKENWRIVIITTVDQSQEEGDSIDWFTEYTPEVYRLPALLHPTEWDDFVNYLLDTRHPNCLLVAGSQYMYERLETLRTRLPSMATVDLLFNTVGHVDSHHRFSHQFDRVIAENEQVEAWFRSIGWSDESINRIESGIDTDRYVPLALDLAWRQKLGIREDDFIVGYSGRMSEEKAPDTFIEIARLCAHEPRLHFLMTGAGPLAEHIKNQTLKVPGGRIHYLGIVTDIQATIGQYDLLVLPSRFDRRPQVVLEALSMGVPVVASNVGGLPALIDEGVNGYLCPADNAPAFSNHLLELVGNRPRVDAMKQAARKFAIEKLVIARMADGYRNALLDAMQAYKGQQRSLKQS